MSPQSMVVCEEVGYVRSLTFEPFVANVDWLPDVSLFSESVPPTYQSTVHAPVPLRLTVFVVAPVLVMLICAVWLPTAVGLYVTVIVWVDTVPLLCVRDVLSIENIAAFVPDIAKPMFAPRFEPLTVNVIVLLLSLALLPNARLVSLTVIVGVLTVIAAQLDGVIHAPLDTSQ